jgi:hypothetical protein
MKVFIFTAVSMLLLTAGIFGQTEKIVLLPVESSKPFIMTGADFEKLESPASLASFGEISDDQKRVQLQIYTSLISEKNETIEFVIQLKTQNKMDLGGNMKFIYLFLTEDKKIRPEKISFAIDSDGKEETRLWLIPNKNIKVPLCMDCLIVKAEDEEKLKEYFELKKSKK